MSFLCCLSTILVSLAQLSQSLWTWPLWALTWVNFWDFKEENQTDGPSLTPLGLNPFYERHTWQDELRYLKHHLQEPFPSSNLSLCCSLEKVNGNINKRTLQLRADFHKDVPHKKFPHLTNKHAIRQKVGKAE